MHGDPLIEVTSLMPQDVVLLHDALETLYATPYTLHLDNAGTAMRFLTAFAAQCEGTDIVLEGCERMHHRPIGPLVDALRSMGADITYIGEEGFPPLRIRGKRLEKRPVTVDTSLSSQFVSALELIGVPCIAPATPYIYITRAMVKDYARYHQTPVEKDWSAAAFWYEYVALHGGEITLPGLSLDSIQGDKVVAELFEPLGVYTEAIEGGIRVHGAQCTMHDARCIDFSACPDLYPAVMMTYHELGVPLQATGIETLAYKESNRLEVVDRMLSTPKEEVIITAHDHRIAMAALAAGRRVDDEECIGKSYPTFKEQLCKLSSPAKA